MFPLFADLRGRRVLVVGGGAVARRKVEALLPAGADVAVGAIALRDAALRRFVDEGRVAWLPGPFSPDWLVGAWLAIKSAAAVSINKVATSGRCGNRSPSGTSSRRPSA